MGLPPPYPVIYEAIVTGGVIPFLGAGAPLYSRNPTVTPWYQRQQGADVISHLPTAGELARYLAVKTQLPESEYGELTKMAQYYKAVSSSILLKKRLSEIFSYEQAPTPLHEFLAASPSPLLIVTTNYDDLMERAYQAAGKPYDVVVHITETAKVLWYAHGQAAPEEILAEDLLIDLDQTSVVYKIHGAIDRRPNSVGTYVITEDDYVEFLSRLRRNGVIPPIFAEPFQDRPFLFLGYGLYDWNLRVIFNSIQELRGNKVRSWAIETLSKPVERKLWEARGVDVYDGITPDQFLAELKKQGAPEGGV